MRYAGLAQWRRPLPEAVVIVSFILGLFVYWFGLANRYHIFLYGHVAQGIPQAQPFDEMTSSRYWMAGLVASGAVMILYSAANGLWGHVSARRKQRFVPTAWWRVWVLGAIPLSIGIPVITMTLNSPTLPPHLAVACVVATLLGLAVALLPGKWAAERPLDLMWLAADGVGLMPPLLLLRAVELPGRGLSIGQGVAWRVAIGSCLAGAVWLGGMSVLRLWRQREMPTAAALVLAGVGLSYLLMPLVHYLLATPPAYRYITTASNFFAFNRDIQLLAMVVASGLALGVTQARRRLTYHRRVCGV